MRKSLALILAAALAAAVAQAGDVYRWKDAKGEWNYSDQPVAGAERISSTGRTPRETTPKPAQQSAKPEASAGNTALADKVREDVAADKAGKCKEARAAYEQAIGSRRLYRQGPNGEQIFLNAQEIDAARVSARANMEYYCGK